MANLEWFHAPEQKDITNRLSDMYERCDNNIKQLCHRFEAMDKKDFNPVNIPLQDIAEIQKIFPQWKSWKLDNNSLKAEKVATLDITNGYTPNWSPEWIKNWPKIGEVWNLNFRAKNQKVWAKIEGNMKF